jgi:ankyrin repeat protein
MLRTSSKPPLHSITLTHHLFQSFRFSCEHFYICCSERTALHLCAEKGDVETSRLLVTSKANVDAKDRRYDRARGVCVHMCVRERESLCVFRRAGYYSVTTRIHVHFCLSLQTDFFCSQRSPLHLSSDQNHIDICRLLLMAKSDVNARDAEYVVIYLVFIPKTKF